MTKPPYMGLQYGLTLVELLVAMLLTAVLLLGLVQLVSAAGAATRLQDNQASLQDRIRYISNLLSDAAGQTAYSPEPWNPDLTLPALAAATADGVSANSDRLALQAWSDLNCFDNRNPDLDSDGRPRFYIRESVFDLNDSAHLTKTCRYGPSPGDMVTQIRRQGLVPGVEAFQLLFGEDSDEDGHVDRWTQADLWTDENRVIGIRAGLLVSGPDSVTASRTERFDVLDLAPREKRDGKLREAVELSLAFRGRTR